MEKLKVIYNLIPYIIEISIILNILGNTIKMTFKIDSKYIIWILIFVSMIIYFTFFGISFESFLTSIITFSFSVSSYDLFKQTKRIYRKE